MMPGKKTLSFLFLPGDFLVPHSKKTSPSQKINIFNNSAVVFFPHPLKSQRKSFQADCGAVSELSRRMESIKQKLFFCDLLASLRPKERVV